MAESAILRSGLIPPGSAMLPSLSVALIHSVLALFAAVSAFSIDRSDNLAVYWGQDSAGQQQRLSFYCEDDTVDIIPLAFLYVFFDKGGYPVMDFSNICSNFGGNSFSGTNLADCSFLAEDIQTCQKKGKVVLLSLGGATAKVGFGDDSQAEGFAELIWNTFLGGKNDIRPFGSAILDGIDLDIESGNGAHYAAFVQRIRSLAQNDDKRYYISAAPQCPFPDQYIGSALNSAHFDLIFVQFYNNYCETSQPSKFNFDTWDQWARRGSPNSNVKIFLGAPGAPGAAGNGYVDIETLSAMVSDAQSRYRSFGGVMLWDADASYNNNRFDAAIKRAIIGGSGLPPFTPTDNHDIDTTSSFRDPRATARVKRPSDETPSLDTNGLGNDKEKRV
ncbi:glycoside hydrolase family 18 protein [Amanita thiersii Skay4041]|uniref:chitinase n=1 Tax=Amanita thiersii Skay4041 TaxID=703135 RepID=A0A2A9NDV7_9AGAR|nr:glycoside hydrolase family 18 protein [Amanita thiersii Skay4041]